MQTKLLAVARAGWLLLTEVPGWPDAAKVARAIRALPIAGPFLGLLVLAGWVQFVREPQMQAVRVSRQPALLLEQEIAALRLACSDEQAVESAAAADRLVHTLVQSPEEFVAQMDAMRAAATGCGWVATLHPNDPGDASPGTEAALLYRTARGRLAPTADNHRAFATLLALLDRLSPVAKHGSLTRLTVRADEQGRLGVEFGVRFATRPLNEKTP